MGQSGIVWGVGARLQGGAILLENTKWREARREEKCSRTGPMGGRTAGERSLGEGERPEMVL